MALLGRYGLFVICLHLSSGQFPGKLQLPGLIKEVNPKLKKRVDATSEIIETQLNVIKNQLANVVSNLGDQRSQLEVMNMQAELDPESVAGVNARIQRLMKLHPSLVCPQSEGYTVHKKSGLRYKLSDMKAKRQDALRFCIGKKASLVKLDTVEKVKAMEEIAKNITDPDQRTFYIGADYFLNKKEGFQWPDRTYVDTKQSPWDAGYPLFPREGARNDCVVTHYIAEKDQVVWRNVKCWEQHRFVCEI